MMNDIFFQDPNTIPLPPEEVRIVTLKAEPRPDGRRVRVYLEITPFQKPPDGEIRILNDLGEELANIAFVETIIPRMEFTLHLRGAELVNPLIVHASLFYTDRSTAPLPAEAGDPQSVSHVDEADFKFSIEA